VQNYEIGRTKELPINVHVRIMMIENSKITNQFLKIHFKYKILIGTRNGTRTNKIPKPNKQTNKFL
jgi:hypothetical protein